MGASSGERSASVVDGDGSSSTCPPDIGMGPAAVIHERSPASTCRSARPRSSSPAPRRPSCWWMRSPGVRGCRSRRHRRRRIWRCRLVRCHRRTNRVILVEGSTDSMRGRNGQPRRPSRNGGAHSSSSGSRARRPRGRGSVAHRSRTAGGRRARRPWRGRWCW